MSFQRVANADSLVGCEVCNALNLIKRETIAMLNYHNTPLAVIGRSPAQQKVENQNPNKIWAIK